MGINKRDVNMITGMCILIFNICMLIFVKEDIIDRYINIGIAVLGLAGVILFRKRNLYLLYSIIGISITVFGSPGNFSGIVFLFISCYDKKARFNIIINSIGILASLYIKMYMFEYHFTQIFLLLVAFFFIAFHMYVRFWNIPSSINEPVARTKGLDIEDRETISMLMKGLKHKDAGKKLNIERISYTSRVVSLRKKYNVKTDFQLAIELIKDDIISLNKTTTVEVDDINL